MQISHECERKKIMSMTHTSYTFSHIGSPSHCGAACDTHSVICKNNNKHSLPKEFALASEMKIAMILNFCVRSIMLLCIQHVVVVVVAWRRHKCRLNVYVLNFIHSFTYLPPQTSAAAVNNTAYPSLLVSLSLTL